jgi:hypothetical protein
MSATAGDLFRDRTILDLPSKTAKSSCPLDGRSPGRINMDLNVPSEPHASASRHVNERSYQAGHIQSLASGLI